MTNSVAARRYARAIFSLALQAGPDSLDATGGGIAAIAALAGKNQDLSRLFHDPVFTAEEKRNVVASLADRLELGPMVRDFCHLLADKRRLGLIEKIAEEYQALADEAKGVVRGEFLSAAPLDAEQQKTVLAGLAKQTGKTPALDFKVDAALLGGMILKIGDTVMDASIRTQLELLKDTIKRGEEDHADNSRRNQ